MNQRNSQLRLDQMMTVFPLVPTVQLSASLMMTVSVYCVVVLLMFLAHNVDSMPEHISFPYVFKGTLVLQKSPHAPWDGCPFPPHQSHLIAHFQVVRCM